MKNSIVILFMVFLLPLFAHSQIKQTGVVTDGAKQPLVGASVSVKGTTVGIVTDSNGEFSLNVQEGATLLVSFIGYQPKEVQASQSPLQIVLEEDNQLINDVVVLGYGTSARKQDLSASVGVISNTEELTKRPVTSTEGMLQGQLAGVSVSSNSGDPTSTPSIVIRGQGSQDGDNVLWVVDGIPGAPIASMDEIESIVVLKDAASAAIYGAHSGAGGVILVTTKKAKKGEPSLSYEVVFGTRQATNLPQGLTAEEQIEMRKTSYANAGLTLPTGWDTSLNPWIATTRTDWMDEIFRTAQYQRHNVSFNVGTDSFKHRLSFSYNDDQGTLINTFNQTLTARYNSSFKLNKWVTVSEDLVWENKQSRGTNTSSAYSGVILSAIYMPRSATVYNPLDGSYGGTTTEDPGYIAEYGSNYSDIHGDVINPVRTLNADTNYNKTSNAWTTTSLEIADVVKGLKFASRFSYNLATQYYKNFTPIRDEVGKPDNSNTLTESSYRTDAWKTENTLTYDGSFGKHNLSALVSATSDHYESRTFSVSGSGFADESENLQYLKYASSVTGTDYLTGPDANVSLISRLAYSYDDRYFATASWRRDYAGRLPDSNNYGDFPAATLGWKISNENFFQKSNFISLLKLRGSWGRVGNLGSIDMNYKSALLSTQDGGTESGQYGVGAGEKWGTGVYYYTALNPDLTWETSEQTDLGLDAEMFRNRLSLSLDYFEKRTFNLIQYQTIEWPSTIGLGQMLVNQGEVRNRGFEFQFNWSDKITKDLSYFVAGNFSTLKNWVSDIGVENTDGSDAVWTGGGAWRNLPYMYQTTQGEPLNSYFLVKTDGIFQSDAEAAAYVDADGNRIQPDAVAGDLKFVDYDGDGEINTSKDRQYSGSAVPDLTYAMTLGVTYKKLSVSAMLQGVEGAQALNVSKYMTLSDVEGNFNRSREILNAWSSSNTSSNIPRLSKSDPNGNFVTPSDWYLEDASYLRIKNVTVSYDMSDLVRKINHFNERNSSMSVYFSGENLHTFTNYSGIDPETGGYDTMTYPVSRVLSFGLKLTY